MTHGLIGRRGAGRAWALALAFALLAAGVRVWNVLEFRENDPCFARFGLNLDPQQYDSWARNLRRGDDLLGREFTEGKAFWFSPFYAYALAGIYRVTEGSYLLGPGDVIAPERFLLRIRNDPEPAAWLRSRFRPATLRILEGWPGTGPAPPGLLDAVVRELNGAIGGPAIFPAGAFEPVRRSDTTRRVNRPGVHGKDLTRAKRMLLEDAFRGDIRLYSSPEILAAKLFQAGLAGVIAWIAFFLGREIGGPGAGAVAALLAAFQRTLIFFDGYLVHDTWQALFVTLLAWTVVRMGTRPTKTVYFWAGVLLGLTAAIRSNLILFLPAALLYPFLKKTFGGGRGEGAAAGPGNAGPPRLRAALARTDFKVQAFQAGAILLGFLPIPLLMALRNGVVTEGKTWSVTRSFAHTTYMGTAHDARWFYTVPPSFNVLQKRYGGNEIPSSELFREIGAHPRDFLRLLGEKFVRYWNGYEPPVNYNFYFSRRYSHVLRWPLVPYSAASALGLLGVFWLVVFERRHRMLAALLVVHAFSISLVYIDSRYRCPAIPLMGVLGGAALAGFGRALRERDWPRLLVAALATAAAVGLSADRSPFPPPATAVQAADPTRLDWIRHNDFANAAWCCEEMDEDKAAETLLRQALQRNSGEPAYILRAAEVLYRRGNLTECRNAFLGYLDVVPGDARAMANLALVFRELKEPEQALRWVEKALAIEPLNPLALRLREDLKK